MRLKTYPFITQWQNSTHNNNKAMVTQGVVSINHTRITSPIIPKVLMLFYIFNYQLFLFGYTCNQTMYCNQVSLI